MACDRKEFKAVLNYTILSSSHDKNSAIYKFFNHEVWKAFPPDFTNFVLLSILVFQKGTLDHIQEHEFILRINNSNEPSHSNKANCCEPLELNSFVKHLGVNYSEHRKAVLSKPKDKLVYEIGSNWK